MVKNGKHLITIRTDNETEFCNKKVEELLKNEGIQHQRSIPYAPEQNGCIEREIRTVVETFERTTKEIVGRSYKLCSLYFELQWSQWSSWS